MAHQSTFVMIKPDGVRRRLVGEVIKRLESKGLSADRIELIVPTRELAAHHYAEHAERPFYPDLIEFITSGPVIAMQWSGESAVTSVRALIGATDPQEALPGTIRGDFGLEVQHNIVHGSDSPPSAARELGIWFG